MIEYLFFFIGAILVSFLLNKGILSFAHKLGITNKNDVSGRWSKISKPSLGGLSMFVTFFVALLIYGFVFEISDLFSNMEFIGLLVASVLAFIMGISDDYYNTKPFLKLFIQILCGVIFVFTDNSIDIFHNNILDGILTIIWVVAVMNSLNMLDNMDGITGTVSFFILGACFVILLMVGNYNSTLWTLLILAEMGALVGFLFFNINPSKMFMGDSGSQFLALFVSFFGIKALWNLPATFENPAWSGIFLVLTAFTPAVADTLTVIINRTKRGVSPMAGGKDHTTHHLAYKGKSDFGVWVIFTLLATFSFSYSILLSYLLIKGYYFYSVSGIIFFLIVFIPLYRNTIKYHPPK